MAFPCSILYHYCLHVAPHIRYERVRRRCGDGGGALGGRGALVRGKARSPCISLTDHVYCARSIQPVKMSSRLAGSDCGDDDFSSFHYVKFKISSIFFSVMCIKRSI